MKKGEVEMTGIHRDTLLNQEDEIMVRKNYLAFIGVIIVLLAYYTTAIYTAIGWGPYRALTAFFTTRELDLLLPTMQAASLLILIPLIKKGTKETELSVIQSKYRIYLTVILTTIALLSILLLSTKTIESPVLNQPNFVKFSSIIPPIIVVSIAAIFIAITTYMKKFYPYSVIFSSALLYIIYAGSQQLYHSNSREALFVWLIAYTSILPVIVIASSWHSEALGAVYTIALSAVLGVITGVGIPQSFEAVEMLALVIHAIFLIFLSGVTALVLFLLKSRSKSANEYLIPVLKVTLSLVIFAVVSFAAYALIFGYFYRGLKIW